ncbi:MAG: radical SAM protein [Candidatus Thorarchaeota archaeon]
MKNAKIVKTSEGNHFVKRRGLPKGCNFCLKGQKAILFLNGICQKPEHCSWYCPISFERRNNNKTFANEIEINSFKELLEEIEKIDAKGMSITGGEPLSELNLEKTIEYIKYIKSQKGKKFHIHLYTNGINFNDAIADRLALVGLDEIRFHPSKKYWSQIELALNKGMDVGAEVPVIPEREKIKELEDFIIFLNKIGADFINLNEFEYCFPNSQELKNRGYQLKNGSIASVVNSQEVGINLLKDLIDKVSLKMNFCPIHSKDYYQLKNRYLRRAKNIKLPYEVITEEGLLLFGQIEGKKEDLEEFNSFLLLEMRIDQNLLFYRENNIKLPFYLAIDNNIISTFENFNLLGYIIEMTPFRRKKYQQITEKTPIKLFREEFGFNAD